MTSGDSPPDDAEESGVGYRKPPRATRFTKGRSGNPAGRPRGRHRETPYETVLGQMVTIREDGSERRVTAAEAFLLQLAKRGLEGDSAAARASLAVIEQAGQRHGTGQFQLRTMTLNFLEPGSVTPAMEPLRMARKLDPYRKTVRIVLEPWLVEAALARLPHTLSPADQRIIVEATRTPHKLLGAAPVMREFDRTAKLVVTDTASRELYDQRQASLSIAKSGVVQALADVNQIRVSLGLQAQPEDSGDLDQVPPDLDQTFSSVLQAQAELIQTAAELGVLHSYNQSPKQMVDEFELSQREMILRARFEGGFCQLIDKTSGWAESVAGFTEITS